MKRREEHPRQSIYEGRLESDTERGTPEGGDAEVQCGCAGLEGVRERSGEKGLRVIGRGQMGWISGTIGAQGVWPW